ncbi:hypothetical protein DL770_011009 [Monosporascus sp. CRB-9-2]|nr:hypothetical protein DL770_011009 [Monosporascus sp. CRB-9-2]
MSSSKKRTMQGEDEGSKKLNTSYSGDLSQSANVPVWENEDVRQQLQKMHNGNATPHPVKEATPRFRFDRAIAIHPYDEDGQRPWRKITPPPSRSMEDWSDAVAAPLWRTLMVLQDRNYLRSEHVTALIQVIGQDVPQRMMAVIVEAGRVIAHGKANRIPSETEEVIRTKNPGYVWSIAQTRVPTDEGPRGHWIGMLHVRSERLVLTFDTYPNPDRVQLLLQLYREAWEGSGFDNPPVRAAIARMPPQFRYYTCGLWVAYAFYIITRDPSRWGRDEISDRTAWGENLMEFKITNMIRGYLGLRPDDEDVERALGTWPGRVPSPVTEAEDDDPDTDQSPRPAGTRRRRLTHTHRESTVEPSVEGTAGPQSHGPTDHPRQSSTRSSVATMPPPPPPIQTKPPMPQTVRPDTTPEKPLFEPKYKPRPAVGDQRAVAMAQGQYVTPYKWVGDTFEDAGQRPEPYFPQGWPGWPKYKSAISTEKPEDKAQQERERAKQREDLARRRGRSPELRMMEDKPRKR